jgi:hypothetical protein
MLNYTIVKTTAQYLKPLDLGNGTFEIRDTNSGLTRIYLNSLVFQDGFTDEGVCLGLSEDALWGIVIQPASAIVNNFDFKPEPLSVRPNPATDRTTIFTQNDLEDRMTYELIDALGIVRLRYEGSASESELDVSRLVNGVYYLRANSNSRLFGITKLIIGR